MSEENVDLFKEGSERFNRGDIAGLFHYFQLWRFEDGKVREVEMFRHRAEAFAAAGLKE